MAARFGWLLTFQLPLDSQKAFESRTATLMWYAVGKIHFVVSGSISVSAHITDAPRSVLPIACTVLKRWSLTVIVMTPDEPPKFCPPL